MVGARILSLEAHSANESTAAALGLLLLRGLAASSSRRLIRKQSQTVKVSKAEKNSFFLLSRLLSGFAADSFM